MKIKIIRCKKCESTSVVRAGKINDNQRYKCKQCGCQFQPNRKSGKPEGAKRLALMLYMFGLSQRSIAKIIQTDVHAVHRWLKKIAQEHYEKTEPVSGIIIIVLSPVGDKNKPLDSLERRVYRKRAVIICAIEVLTAPVRAAPDILWLGELGSLQIAPARSFRGQTRPNYRFLTDWLDFTPN
jgi:transposase-like protein